MEPRASPSAARGSSAPGPWDAVGRDSNRQREDREHHRDPRGSPASGRGSSFSAAITAVMKAIHATLITPSAKVKVAKGSRLADRKGHLKVRAVASTAHKTRSRTAPSV